MDPEFKSAEFAILVHDLYQKEGIGRKIMEMLINIGREKNLEQFVGTVLADNDEMLKLARKLGFSARWLSDGVDGVTLKLKDAQENKL